MRLSWNEIRARAGVFAQEWRDARYEKGESQTFYNELFQVFGVTRRRVATFEEPIKQLDKKKYGFIDLFWKGVLLVEQKSAGRDLTRAKTQAFDYFPGIKETDLPRYVLVSDFQLFELYDLDEGTEVRFALSDLPRHIEHFGFILGVQKRTFHDQDPVNIAASELMGKLHDALKASGYEGHDLERLLVRLLFCLFADDTGIFEPRGIFQELLTARTSEDGSDTGAWLMRLFEVLNRPEDRRQKALDEDLNRFPYVNGNLFEERLAMPDFNAGMRKILLDACAFNWDAISPAIFGALFQSVMDVKARRKQGAHYTTERNIMKVIQPLFLDGLREEFARLRERRDTGRQRALIAFHDRLAALTFFDPACGCGNFLIIAYRELRSLELDLLTELHRDILDRLSSGVGRLDVSKLSKLDVDQFFGIELEEFPARIAEAAIWMMDHIMNVRLSLTFGDAYARIPLKKSPQIHNGDALELDWADILPADRCGYVFGNPPFIGAKYQSEAQRRQVRRIAMLGGSGGTLDYVAAWFLKAGAYVQGGTAAIGFVATNSVTQGEQVAQLWPLLFGRFKLEIAFAHRTFAWGSDARGVAHVHVVIIGLVKRDAEPAVKRLFSYDDINGNPTESYHGKLLAYLIAANESQVPHLVVYESNYPLSGSIVPEIRYGSQPIDGGNLILSAHERDELLKSEPRLRQFLHPFVGAWEFLNGGDRWIFALQGASPSDLKMPELRRRLRNVRRFRLQSQRPATRKLADYPIEFHFTTIPKSEFLILPEVSSERRRYMPVGFCRPPVIPSNLVRVIEGASVWHFVILTSAMHMAWLRQIGGRLKSDYRYSIGLVYNTFPWPEADAAQERNVSALGQRVLDARGAHPGATLADLYDPDTMPPDLRRAHKALDVAVDRLYRAAPFNSDRERVEHLFGLYEKLATPALAAMAAPKSKRGRRAT